jgi:N-acyl-phosphatidylethanolamine-hydrolysing phospholipase D
MKRLFTIIFAILWSGCAVTQSVIKPDLPAHHSENGFTNPHIIDPEKSFFQFLKMRFLGEDPWTDHDSLASNVPVQQVDLQTILSSAKTPQITWLGHSTFLIQHNGINVLTDPIFADRASPISFAGPKRYIRHVVDYKKLPKIDLVVISHNHYDHLDEQAITTLGNNTSYAVPLKNKDWLMEEGINEENIIELDWWQQANVNNIDIQALPSQHWSARGLGDRFEALWASWSIRLGDLHIWFGGDTGYNPVQFKQIGERTGGFDLALIPIGAYAPRWFMQSYHVNPEEAVYIHLDVKSQKSIGMHWGTFPLTAEPPTEPPKKLAEARLLHDLPADEFITMTVGETLKLATPD